MLGLSGVANSSEPCEGSYRRVSGDCGASWLAARNDGRVSVAESAPCKEGIAMARWARRRS